MISAFNDRNDLGLRYSALIAGIGSNPGFGFGRFGRYLAVPPVMPARVHDPVFHRFSANAAKQGLFTGFSAGGGFDRIPLIANVLVLFVFVRVKAFVSCFSAALTGIFHFSGRNFGRLPGNNAIVPVVSEHVKNYNRKRFAASGAPRAPFPGIDTGWLGDVPFNGMFVGRYLCFGLLFGVRFRFFLSKLKIKIQKPDLICKENDHADNQQNKKENCRFFHFFFSC